ncbi:MULTISPECIES: DUF6578 domain-containing protein [unclassified Streptomyces]|uniref:DUF6578 domain-containing protein n=1 Tax=unclassified Streptomyces TaxID=2593676 RepID=UPI003D75C88E
MGMRQVFYEDWQMECCGRPFAVGDEVGWPLRPADGADAPAPHVVERHGDKWPETTGRVREILMVTQGYAETGPGSRTWEPVPGTRSLRPVDRCPKWFRQGEPGERGVRHDEVGVLVTLDVPAAP